MDLGPVFPVLKPADWPGKKANACRPLVPGLTAADQPLVAYCYSESPLRAFVGPKRLEVLGKSREEVEAEALENLSRSQPDFSLRPVNLPSGGSLDAASGPEDLYSVERILHGAFMAHLQRSVFDCRYLAVALPGRPFLMAAPLERALDGALLEVARWTYRNLPEGDDRLTPEVFVLDGGVIVGRVSEQDGTPTLDLLV